MHLTVTARGALADRIPGGAGVTLTGTEATVGALLDHLGLARSSCVVVVNGTAANAMARLRDGDRVQLYPQQAGG
ncbi:MAG TPA: MoaD/ThiS family protein [Jiangellales bacterium]|nr:MoaD/ThiS family protein [Jiangellales bacterium]